jgi:hypothetical protein
MQEVLDAALEGTVLRCYLACSHVLTLQVHGILSNDKQTAWRGRWIRTVGTLFVT